jgi:hypothetical protein
MLKPIPTLDNAITSAKVYAEGVIPLVHCAANIPSCFHKVSDGRQLLACVVHTQRHFDDTVLLVRKLYISLHSLTTIITPTITVTADPSVSNLGSD